MSAVECMIEYAAIALLDCDEDQWDRLPQDKRIPVKAEVEDALKSLGLPLETLAALKAGTWRAVPVAPTDEMARPLTRLWLLADQESTTEDKQLARQYAAAVIAAAPAKPEDRE